MPELPEVETVRRSLLPSVVGCLIAHTEILTPGVLINAGLPLTGWLIDGIDRRGKYLIFALSGNERMARLIVHLRMTGRLLLQEEDRLPEKHTHVRFRLEPTEGGGQTIWLVFHDPRRFGRIWLIEDADAMQPQGLCLLGPEPLGEHFDVKHLAEVLARRKSSLKAVLLDQKLIAGLGNIYADEVLFASELNPARVASSLSPIEIDMLTTAIRAVLSRAIDCCGTTLRDYADGWNRKGTFQDCLMVYGRGGQPCRNCGATILKAKMAGRGTCWCPACQK